MLTHRNCRPRLQMQDVPALHAWVFALRLEEVYISDQARVQAYIYTHTLKLRKCPREG